MIAKSAIAGTASALFLIAGLTWSKDPTNFGVDDDRYLVETLPVAAPEIVESHGQLYIAALLPSLKGIQVAKLGWEKKP